jgi:hypothetical protein
MTQVIKFQSGCVVMGISGDEASGVLEKNKNFYFLI